jgi:hypothetical protein
MSCQCPLLAQSGHSLLHMSAFGGKAEMTICGNPLLRSLLGVTRTWRFVGPSLNEPQLNRYDGLSLALRRGNATAGIHIAFERCRNMAACGARSANYARGGFPQRRDS